MLVLVFLASEVYAAEVPNLIGNWTGSWSGYDLGMGYSNSTENDTFAIAITEQNGRIFSGNMSYSQANGTLESEAIAGVIGADNKSIYTAESGKGYVTGTIVSADELELIYLADGKEMSAGVDRLYRTKA
ncbi:MAG TPA: hypothetical protein VN455_04765 [Methanotrichaceae archaeon]|nr:hypothetical protein [Methanotrichaceae archaeon]